MELLPDRLAWFIAGPIIGLLVVALYAVANKHLGVTTSYLQVMTFVRSPRTAEMWRVWFFAGLVGGSLLAVFPARPPHLGVSPFRNSQSRRVEDHPGPGDVLLRG